MLRTGVQLQRSTKIDALKKIVIELFIKKSQTLDNVRQNWVNIVNTPLITN